MWPYERPSRIPAPSYDGAALKLWRVAKRVRLKSRRGRDVSAEIDELEVMAMHTTFPELRQRIDTMLSAHRDRAVNE